MHGFVSSRKWARVRRLWESTWDISMHDSVRVLPGKAMSVGLVVGKWVVVLAAWVLAK